MQTDNGQASHLTLLAIERVITVVAVACMLTACGDHAADEPCPSNNGSYPSDDNNKLECYPPVDCSAGLRDANPTPLAEDTCMEGEMPTCTNRVVAHNTMGPCLDLSGQELRYIFLRFQKLQGSSFAGSDLTGATLAAADLREANFRDATLRDANLGCADLRRADFTNADLSGADFQCGPVGASLRGAIIHNTICPDGTVADESCNDRVPSASVRKPKKSARRSCSGEAG